MRILHTADWHLGSSLSGHKRIDEFFGQIEHICQLTEEHNVDVLLVAGDIFESRASMLPELTKQLANTLAPYVRRGLHVILMPGNHDNRDLFRMIQALLTLENDQTERVHVVQTREIFSIDNVQFAVIPYPTPELLEPYLPESIGTTQRNVALSKAYAELVRGIVNALDPSRPAIFVGHINVAGVTTPSDHELNYNSDLRLGREDLPVASNLAYIALGHIHRCQELSHPIPCYYSGSIDRLNWGEKDDNKAVLLVDVPQNGPATVTPFPIQATPFYDLSLKSADLDTLMSRYPDLDRAFVHVHLECQVGDDPVALQRQVRELCPRCLEVQLTGEGLSSPIAANLPANPRDYATTVLEHLRQVYADDPDLPELEKRTNDLLREVSDAIAKN